MTIILESPAPVAPAAVAAAPPPGLPILSASNLRFVEGDARLGATSVALLLDRAPTAPVTVRYALIDSTAAAAAGDYDAGFGTVTFAAGQRTAAVPIVVRDDARIEANETLSVALSNLQGAAFAEDAPALVATVTILDDDGAPANGVTGADGAARTVLGPVDDGAPTPVISVLGATVNETDTGSTSAYAFVLLSKRATTDVFVNYATVEATAATGADFLFTSGTLRIAAGEMSAWVRTPVFGDTFREIEERFSIVFSNAVGGRFEGGTATASARIVIRDDESAQAPLPASGPNFVLAGAPLIDVNAAFANILRVDPASAIGAPLFAPISSRLASGALTPSAAIAEITDLADATTAVATLSYQFFTGKAPTAGGLDYLVSPTGPNANHLNSAYYQSFSLENRYINFAVNLGKLGEGAQKFALDYGAKTLADATRDAYAAIFGSVPTADKVTAILTPTFTLNGVTLSRAEYFAFYGQDGLNGIGTKAAMVGWLLSEAAKADIGQFALSNEALFADLADGAALPVDMVGVYGRPEFVYAG